MPKADSKWVSISMTVEKGNFPLTGSELKEALQNLWVFPIAITNPEFYAKWFETHTRIGDLITKLLDWAQQYAEVIPNESIAEETTA